jgi:hypothetical protein
MGQVVACLLSMLKALSLISVLPLSLTKKKKKKKAVGKWN